MNENWACCAFWAPPDPDHAPRRPRAIWTSRTLTASSHDPDLSCPRGHTVVVFRTNLNNKKYEKKEEL